MSCTLPLVACDLGHNFHYSSECQLYIVAGWLTTLVLFMASLLHVVKL